MWERLDYLFDRDVRSRWRMILVSACSVAAIGFVAQKRGSSLHDAEIIAAIIGSGIFLAQIAVYLVEQRVVHAPQIGRVLISRAYVVRAAIAFASSALVAVLASVSAPVAQAAILDRRLRSLTRSIPLSDDRAQAVAASLKFAVQSKPALNLQDATTAHVRDAIKQTAEQDLKLRSLPTAADELVRYAAINRTQVLESHNEAVAAFSRGLEHLASPVSPLPLEEYQAAISEFTKAIELAGGDYALKRYALMNRAGTYNILGRYSEALMDAENAEKLGAIDLGLLATVEGQALVHLSRSREDLQRAIGLLTLRLEMSSPPLLPDERFFMLRARAEAYYGLRRFAEALTVSQTYLSMLPQQFRLAKLGDFFAIPIFSYLRLGDIDGARNMTVELEQRTGDRRLELIRQILETYTYPSDPVQTITAIRRVAPEPPIHDQ